MTTDDPSNNNNTNRQQRAGHTPSNDTSSSPLFFGSSPTGLARTPAGATPRDRVHRLHSSSRSKFEIDIIFVE